MEDNQESSFVKFKEKNLKGKGKIGKFCFWGLCGFPLGVIIFACFCLFVSCIGILMLILFLHSEYIALQYYEMNTLGDERYYVIHAPESLETSFVPLLIAVHGGGGNARSFRDTSQFAEIADKYGFIVVFPEGVCQGFHTMCTWNSGSISSDGQDDVQFFDDLISMMMEKNFGSTQIDESKIFIVGHSNGGMMTYRYATQGSHELNTIAVVSGTIGARNADTKKWYLPPDVSTLKPNILHLHGLVDQNVKIDGGYPTEGFSSQKERFDLPMNKSMDYWMEQHECDEISVSEERVIQSAFDLNRQLCLSKYSKNCGNDKTVRSLILRDGPHQWDIMNSLIEDNEPKNSFSEGSNSLSELIWNLIKPSSL